MVNTERKSFIYKYGNDYNILNIVVNTEPATSYTASTSNYNILNIVVNTELEGSRGDYNSIITY